MPSVAVVGLQWGDEGKGKVVDALTADAEVVCRYGGGANAGHTVFVGEDKFVLHLIPSGILHERVRCLIGNGVVVQPDTLLCEIAGLRERGVDVSPGRLTISERAHVVMPYHPALDRLRESRRGRARLGTTGRGIGPCYTDKTARTGLRMADLVDPDAFRRRLALVLPEKRALLLEHAPETVDEEALLAARERWAPLFDYVGETVGALHDALDGGDRVLFEGAQGALLDLDHGTYPYCTSSNAGIGGLSAGSGVPPDRIDCVIGVAKAYCTRVGAGPFPTELTDEAGVWLRDRGQEYGATTGRERRCGWFDVPAMLHAIRFCGVQAICLTKLDVLSGRDTIPVCTGYRSEDGRTLRFPARAAELETVAPIWESHPGWSAPLDDVRREEDLPPEARAYVHALEAHLGVPIQWLSVGRRRDQLVSRRGAPPWPER